MSHQNNKVIPPIDRIYVGDAVDILRQWPDEMVQCVVTSPPYYGLRDYGATGQMGLEKTPQEYLHKMVVLFREVRRVLRKDGTLWLNMGDSYAGSGKGQTVDGCADPKNNKTRGMKLPKPPQGLKAKDLMGMPWRLAFALQEPYKAPCRVGSEIDRAWLAAMFDGEGCIGIRRFDSYRKEKQQVYQDGFVAYTVVTNNDIELLDRCVEIARLGKPALKQSAGSTDGRGIVSRRDSYGWRLDGNGAVDVIRAIYPYLIANRKQACISYTLDVLNKNGHGSRCVPQEIQEKKQYLWQLIKKCNQREQVDIPSWIEEPKELIEPGWYLRSDIIWAKPNPLPESVTDRPTKSHEYLFLLSKSKDYYYDAEAIKEPATMRVDVRPFGDAGGNRHGDEGRVYVVPNGWDTAKGSHTGKTGRYKHLPEGQENIRETRDKQRGHHRKQEGNLDVGTKQEQCSMMRNKRDVWEIATFPYPEAHFATFPPDLVKPCILAGTQAHDIVLDPFMGSGTTALVATGFNRHFLGIELNSDYAKMAEKRAANELSQGKLF